MKYPIGIQSFERIREDGFIYVDKTALLYRLVTEGRIYFLSRPRRFGKSLLVSTLENYFLGRKEYFQGLAINQLEQEWLSYPVFHIDFNGANFTNQGMLVEVLNQFVENAEKKYGLTASIADISLRFCNVLEAAHKQTGRRAVVLVDEYDKPLLDVMNARIPSPVITDEMQTLEDYNREQLKGFYSVFKLADKHMQFVLLTGVTKFSQVSVFSGFNQPKDISLDARFDALCGITKAELLEVFDRQIAELGEANGMTKEETIERLTRKYDGYHFSGKMEDVFNPFSLLNCLDSQRFDDFWFATGTPTYLMRLMTDNRERINEMAGKYYEAAEFINYKATRQHPLPMLYQSGYLTIKDYHPRRNAYLLDFPNEEVRSGMVSLLAADYFQSGDNQTNWLNEVTDSLEAGDLDTFHRQLTAFLADISYRFQRKQDERACERHFQYTFYLIMRMLGKFSVYVEKETSQGRIDCVLECPGYVYLFEFKLNSTAAVALKQIDEKGYALPYASDPRKLYKVGISFSSETGTINDFGYCLAR